MRRAVARWNPFTAIATFMLVVAAFYWGRPILMPVALAMLLTFLLSPMVNALRRRGLNQTASVTLVVILMFSLLGAIIGVIGDQVSRLAQALPEYKDNISQKIADLRKAGQGTPLEKVQETIKELTGELKQQDASTQSPVSLPLTTKSSRTTNAPAPIPVVVQGEKSAEASWLSSSLGPVSDLLLTAGLVIVLVIFMLLRREELRDRLILLGGLERLTITTKILREAGQRITRYLVVQSLINGVYGLVAGLGLFFIGLPYALLWSFLAAIVRFIPYVGPWIGALFPIVFALAFFPGWLSPLLVIVLFVVLELTTNMLLEPIFYGSTAGVSEVALLIALAFWTWVWGPIGLALGTPLTVCLVVLAKYVPQMEFIRFLLSDEPIAEQGLIYYERLLAQDKNEAEEIVTKYLSNHTLEQTCDDLLLPALVYCKQDRLKGRLTTEKEQSILQTIRDILEKMDLAPEITPDADHDPLSPQQNELIRASTVKIIGWPAGEESDEVALLMLKKLMADPRCEMEVLPSHPLPKIFSFLHQNKPDLICIGALPPAALSRGQHLQAKLQGKYPDEQIVIGPWGLSGNTNRKLLRTMGAEYVGTTLADTRLRLISAVQLLLAQREIIRQSSSGRQSPSAAKLVT